MIILSLTKGSVIGVKSFIQRLLDEVGFTATSSRIKDFENYGHSRIANYEDWAKDFGSLPGSKTEWFEETDFGTMQLIDYWRKMILAAHFDFLFKL